MDTKQIVFIICKNDTSWYEECVRYIQDLYIPEGYTVDILSIEDAESVSLAYNAAMEAGNAEYKVYLYQDTFILHRGFIQDILSIFAADSSIGMIGMAGYRKFPVDVEGHQHWDIGRVCIDNGSDVYDLNLQNNQDKKAGYFFVEAIDGFLMVTREDIKWEEGGVDRPSYDVWQCQKMLDHGKRIVIPWQAEPWCYHRHWGRDEIKALRQQLTGIAEAGAYDVIWPIIDEVRGLEDRESHVIAALAEDYALEKASCQGLTSEWWMSHIWGEIYNYYEQIRFVLMRAGCQREDERIQELQKMVWKGRIHKDAILSLAGTITPVLDRIYPILLRECREEPLVSVILPVYNGAVHVGETIESILGQTYRNMEIIIVDDASTDHSLEVIRSYHDSRIKVITCEKNRNIVYSGNLGFKAAKGKYVALIGHDDLWKQDKLEKQVAFLEEHLSYSVCFTRMDVIDENLRICKDSFCYRLFSETNRTSKAWIRKLFIGGNCLCAPSACIRKEMLDKVGYYRYALLQLQDYDLWLRLFLEGEVYIYPEKLTFYRQFNNKKNLSAINDETAIRSIHEKQFICSHYIKDMAKEQFIDVFSGDMLDVNAYGEKEILCEKALLLWRKGFYSGHYDLAELLEDEECREILEINYHIDLAQFYRLNAQPVHFE